MAGELPEDVQAFLRDHITSVMQLEVLLRLRDDPEQAWAPMQLSRELGGSVDLVIGCLTALQRGGLVEQVDPDELTFRYGPSESALADAVDHTADVYARRKVAVVTEIFREPDDPLREFSDAFRVRRRR